MLLLPLASQPLAALGAAKMCTGTALCYPGCRNHACAVGLQKTLISPRPFQALLSTHRHWQTLALNTEGLRQIAWQRDCVMILQS
jgi:hypothetical protein